jgi:hypothetical protein
MTFGDVVTLNQNRLLEGSSQGDTTFLWSDPSVWDPHIPLDGDDVRVDLSTYQGCGQPLIVDVSTRA